MSVREDIESRELVVIQEWWPDSGRVTDVDDAQPQALRPQPIEISERSHQRRMGACRAVDPPAKRGGAKRTVDVREVMNGIMYILSTGCQWRALPKDLPPRSTVHSTCGAMTARSTASTTRFTLRAASRVNARQARPPLLSTARA